MARVDKKVRIAKMATFVTKIKNGSNCHKSQIGRNDQTGQIVARLAKMVRVARMAKLVRVAKTTRVAKTAEKAKVAKLARMARMLDDKIGQTVQIGQSCQIRLRFAKNS